MINAELEFPYCESPLIIEKLLGLPEVLRPSVVSFGEDERGTAISDAKSFASTFELKSYGIFFRNEAILYDLRKARNGNLLCGASFTNPQTEVIRDFLVSMGAGAIFGYACVPEEREKRNRAVTRQGENVISSWVGRDSGRYLPGLYWWTIFANSLLRQYRIPLEPILEASVERLELGSTYLFRFYERPEDWESSTVMSDLYARLPGIFNIDSIRPQLEGAGNFITLSAVVDQWR